MTTSLSISNLVLPAAQAKAGSYPPRVKVDMERRMPGIVELAASPEHLIRVHADQVEGACAQARFRYGPGDIDILPAGLVEQWEEFSPSTSLALRLPGAVLHEAAEHVGLSARWRGLEPRFQLRDPQISHVAWALNAERESGYPNGVMYSDFLAMALAVHLLGKYRAPSRVHGGLAKHALRRVTEYIEENLGRDLTLAALAGLADMSASHFGVQFKKSTGVPVHEYVIRRRAERARELLQESELAISQVALETGFAHQSHLAKWMQRFWGITPAQVRTMR